MTSPRATAAADRAADGADAPAFRLDEAAVRLGGREIWSGLSVVVPAGEFVAVLGPNGAGKSTLLRLLLGLVPPSAGSVTVLGTTATHARRRVSYVPQRHPFDASLPVRGVDVVQLGLDGARWGVPWPGRAWRGDRQRVADAIATVGADGYASRPVGQLSGGEQQRLLIAQALVRDPELLLLDEPLEGLDLSSQQAVVGLIARICQTGVTVVMVAHDVNPVFGYLDRVVYIAGGHAVAGRPGEVITTENLTRLYGATVEVLRASDGRLVVVGGPEATSFHAQH